MAPLDADLDLDLDFLLVDLRLLSSPLFFFASLSFDLEAFGFLSFYLDPFYFLDGVLDLDLETCFPFDFDLAGDFEGVLVVPSGIYTLNF